MTEQEKTAADIGALGGKARAAALTPERRREIALLGVEARREKSGVVQPRATHVGILTVAGREIECAVLEDGKRVLTTETFLVAIGRSPKGKGGQVASGPDGLPPFLSATALKPFIDQELGAPTAPILYRTVDGGRALGYEADLLPKVCEIYLKARDADALTSQQQHIAKACEILMRGLATVGIIALVDEATGYQQVRDREALQQILDKYLRKEFAVWASQFPDTFYKEIFRLRGWQWKGMKINRPQCVASYTKDFVYSRLAPDLLKELETRNPTDENGKRKAKHYYWLTEDIGHPALSQHLHAVIGLMRASDDWEQFKKMINRAFPKRSLQRELFNQEDD